MFFFLPPLYNFVDVNKNENRILSSFTRQHPSSKSNGCCLPLSKGLSSFVMLKSSPIIYEIFLLFIWSVCPALCDPMDCSTPGFPVLHSFLEFAQTHVHWINDTIQPSHPLSPPSPPVLNLSQHQDLFQWVYFLHQVAKGLELQLWNQSFQWIFRVDFL